LFLKAVLVLYNLVLTYGLLFLGLPSAGTSADWVLLLFLLPAAIYFTFVLAGKIRGIKRILALRGLSLIKTLTFCLSLVTTSLLLTSNLLGADAPSEYLFALIVSPLPIYFWGAVVGRIIRGLRKLPQDKVTTQERLATEEETAPVTPSAYEEIRKDQATEPSRRDFLKRIGSVGLGILVYSILNPREAGAAFFGSVPGPGTVSIKDTTDTKIDPAISSPTDAFGIYEIDDGDPAYYGFINKAGYWYILQEDETAGDFSYRYLKGGPNDFPANWAGRGGWTYQYFNQIFG